MCRLLATSGWCALVLGAGACSRPAAPGDAPLPAVDAGVTVGRAGEPAPPGPDPHANLKRICAAIEEYKEEHDGYFPPPSGKAYRSKRGLGLSWRVHLLPNLGEEALYKQFNLDEPWDSAHNKPLVERMPAVYTTPGADLPPGQTYDKVFTGPTTAFPPGGLGMSAHRGFNNAPLLDLSDGTSNTLMIAQGGAPVVWTKPEDIPYDPDRPLPDLRLAGQARIAVALCDGRVRTLDLDAVSEKTLRAAITRSGGEVLGEDWNEDGAQFGKVAGPGLKANGYGTHKLTLGGRRPGGTFLMLDSQPVAHTLVVELKSSRGTISVLVRGIPGEKNLDELVFGWRGKSGTNPTEFGRASGESGKVVAPVPKHTALTIHIHPADKLPRRTEVEVTLSKQE